MGAETKEKERGEEQPRGLAAGEGNGRRAAGAWCGPAWNAPRPMPCGGSDARGPSVIGRPGADGWMRLAGRGRLLIMDWRLLRERGW
jgi:hypothetical protein